MAVNEEERISLSEEDAEDREKRGEAFFVQLNISELLFPNVLDGAIAHALAARPPAGAPPARNWQPVGPRNVGGRIREMAQDPRNPSTLYAGSALGGVWRTRNGGDTWESLGDIGNPAVGSIRNDPVGAIAIPEQNPNVLYIGTGDQVDFYVSGRGLWKATLRPDPNPVVFDQLIAPDPPATLPAAATAGAAPRYTRIQVDPEEPARFWAASPTGVWQCDCPIAAGSAAVFKRVLPPVGAAPAVPGGAPALPGAVGQPYATDLLVARDPRPGAPARSLIVYAAISGQGVYRGRYDRAADTITWDALLAVPSPASFGRVRLALCKNQPQNVYALLEDRTAGQNGHPTVVYRSTDSGTSWAPGANRMPRAIGYAAGNGIAWYALALTVHPDRPNILIAGTVDLCKSEDSGDNWTTLISWPNYDSGDRAQHADQHSVLFDAGNRHRIWVGNDGGISMAHDIRRSPGDAGFWRKRSHGLLAAQFQDVTVHPTLPFLCGGGLQDNGTYLSFGGPTWFHIGGGDGGMMGFDPTNPRNYFISTQGGVWSASVVAASMPVPPLVYQKPVVNDVPAPLGSMAVQMNFLTGAIPAANSAPFVGLVEHHPTVANSLLLGRRGAGFSSINGGATWNVLTAPPPPPGGAPLALAAAEEVSALAFGAVSAAPNLDGWLGTSLGQVFVTNNAPAGSWTQVAVPWPAADPTPRVSRIATHPTNTNVVAIATAGPQGRVMLTYNRGANWLDITAPVPAAANRDLPPCPITSLAFDPVNTRELYAGTLAGVYTLRNLPAQPAGGAVIAAFPIDWRPFNTRLPVVLIQDLAFLPGTRILRAATYGRSMYDCDLAGGPRHRLFIRQLLTEDGRADARPAALPFGGSDPRLPAPPNAAAVALDMAHAFDIRVDAPPFSFFEEVMDGVEFDEDLASDTLVPGEVNVVYVQVHNRGFDPVRNATVHLYFRPSPAVALGGAVPVLGNLADIWRPAQNFDPVAGSPWQRVARAQTLPEVGPARPAVARFDWTPPANLAGGNVALLALCSGPAGPVPPAADPLPAAIPGGVATLVGLIANERRAALRVAPVGPFQPEIFIRHGLEDDGTPGAVAFGGRSPDILVVQSVPAQPPEVEFQDLGDPRLGDRLKGGTKNLIYVRVHNRKNLPIDADVEVLFAKTTVPLSAAADPAAPPYDPAKWQQIAPVATVTVPVPARGWSLARLEWDNPDDPDQGAAEPYRAYLLIALIKSHDNADPVPVRTRVDSTTFWSFFRALADSRKAALRAVRYEP